VYCKCIITIVLYLPAILVSLHASYMFCLISGLSSAIVSPTVTNLSTAKFTAWPTLATARKLRSEHSGRSLCEINVEICKDIAFWWVHRIESKIFIEIPFQWNSILKLWYNWWSFFSKDSKIRIKSHCCHNNRYEDSSHKTYHFNV